MTEEVTVKVIEAFGKFIVDLGEDSPSMFDTEADANTALAEYENGAEHRALAAAYCANQGIEADSKNAKGKENVISGFLAWVDAGQPARSEADIAADAAKAAKAAPAKTEEPKQF